MEKIKKTITIGKTVYSVTEEQIPLERLKFYSDNPRVYSVVNTEDGEKTQAEIEQLMTSLERTKSLKSSIESNGGLLEPIIVRGGSYEVLEGNTRLAAYRILLKTNPNDERWKRIRSLVLPADISDEAVFCLLGQYHIVGKQPWDPFEQASYLYRRINDTKLPVESIAKELGLQKGKVKQMIGVIEFMKKQGDDKKANYSYYDEYLKSSSIKKYRESKPELDTAFADEVISGKINDAQSVRKLGKIASAGGKEATKTIDKIAKKEMTIEEGYNHMEECGKVGSVVEKLQKFRDWIVDSAVKKQFENLDDSAKNQADFFLKKISKTINDLLIETLKTK